MGTGAGSEVPARPKVPFLGRRLRKLQIALAVVTAGFYLLGPLSVWLWRTGRRRGAYVSGSIFALFVIVIAVAASQGGKKTAPTSTTTASPAKPAPSQSSMHQASTLTGATRAADDARAKAALARALKVVASNYQDFGDYTLVTTYTLGNLDHALRAVHGLTAHGQGKTFSLSVLSASGTTYRVRGDHVRLRRTCAPAGAGCAGGHWSGTDRLVLPKVPVVTASDKAKVSQILSASVDHYAHLLALGESALGSTQYATANAGLAAFSDPNSAASRFRDYRKRSNPEGDLSFLNAFKQADRFYTAANEPNAISTWRDDMDTATVDLNEFVTLAVGWQIREHTTTQLQASERRVDAALAKARSDVAAVVAGH
jgi:hypothetical protein